jgi:dTDP-glucose 4,6-dehydratase
VAVIRPFNTYGPRQSTRAVIPTIITQILAGEKRIKLGSIHPTRDFSYIKDVVRGFEAVAESDRTVGEVVNIGSNFEISVRDTVALIADCMGKKVAVESDDQRKRPPKSEVERLWADNTKARKLAGWKPIYGGLKGFKKGLMETIQWYSIPEKLKRYPHEGYQV